MKTIVLLVAVLFISFKSIAQIEVSPRLQPFVKPTVWGPDDLKKLKSTRTIMVIRDKDEENMEQIKEFMKEVWTFTEVEVVTYSEFKENKYWNKDDVSFITISGFLKVVSSKTGNTYYDYVYLNLWMNSQNKRGKTVERSFARIELYPTAATYGFIIKSYMGQRPSLPFMRNNSEYLGLTWMEYYYTKSVLYNYQLGFIKNYLKAVNSYLESGKNRGFYYSGADPKQIVDLKNETLYIPDYIFNSYNGWTGAESKLDVNKIMAKYPYKYEILTAEDLSKKILDKENKFYYLTYVRSNAERFINVTNSETGEIIYSKYKTGFNYNFKDSDFNDIAKVIAKPPKK